MVTVGGVMSRTVTMHGVAVVAVLPASSVHVRVTCVLPTLYGPAGLCVQPTKSPSGSLDPLLILAGAPQAFAGAETVTFVQRGIGGLLGGSGKSTILQDLLHMPSTRAPPTSCVRPL